MPNAKTMDRYFKIHTEIKDLLATRGLETRAVAPIPLSYIVVNRSGQSLLGYQLMTSLPQVLVISSTFKHTVPLDVLLWEIDLATVDLAEAVK